MKRLYFCLCLVVLVACYEPTKLATTAPSSGSIAVDGKLWSSLFHQKSAEYKALCIQAYNIARLRLDNALAEGSAKPLAVITDIDETFLDNSPYAVSRALQGLDYDTTTWFDWTSKAIADSIPGSLGFFNYAASKNVEVFYVTNRKEKERAVTLQNLQRYGYPFADDRHLMPRQTSSSKEQRRQNIAATYNIVLLIGDNLADFSSVFDGRNSTEQRAGSVQQLAGEFGKKFIILPNINYGGWEDAVYGYRPLEPAKKDSAIKSNLKSF